MNLQIENTLIDLQNEIRTVCERSGRKLSDVKILAVSKLQPVSKVQRLFDLGQRLFAENYVQEALAKQIELKNLDIEWHLIGHIQRKKINSILGQFSMIHSIDSLDLAQSLSKKCEAQKLTQKILLQVNMAGEASKEGWIPNELKDQWSVLSTLPGLQICGLMTMPPLSETGETVRKYFRDLRLLKEELQNIELQKEAQLHPLIELSMGTSQDYLVAIEEGSTYVRIGTRLFGERQSL